MLGDYVVREGKYMPWGHSYPDALMIMAGHSITLGPLGGEHRENIVVTKDWWAKRFGGALRIDPPKLTDGSFTRLCGD